MFRQAIASGIILITLCVEVLRGKISATLRRPGIKPCPTFSYLAATVFANEVDPSNVVEFDVD